MVCTPHLGAATSEAQENVALQIAEQMADYLVAGAIANALNAPSVTAEEAPILKPWIALAEMLGSFAGQVTEHAIEEIEIEYVGEVGHAEPEAADRGADRGAAACRWSARAASTWSPPRWWRASAASTSPRRARTRRAPSAPTCG